MNRSTRFEPGTVNTERAMSSRGATHTVPRIEPRLCPAKYSCEVSMRWPSVRSQSWVRRLCTKDDRSVSAW